MAVFHCEALLQQFLFGVDTPFMAVAGCITSLIEYGPDAIICKDVYLTEFVVDSMDWHLPFRMPVVVLIVPWVVMPVPFFSVGPSASNRHVRHRRMQWLGHHINVLLQHLDQIACLDILVLWYALKLLCTLLQASYGFSLAQFNQLLAHHGR